MHQANMTGHFVAMLKGSVKALIICREWTEGSDLSVAKTNS